MQPAARVSKWDTIRPYIDKSGYQEVYMPSKDPLRGKQNPSPSPQANSEEKIVFENINITGHTTRVNAKMYHAMRQAMLKVLPFTGPGMTQAEIRTAVIPHLPEDLYPGGAKAGWWAKMVQLDLEAKGILAREATKPLRWHQIKQK